MNIQKHSTVQCVYSVQTGSHEDPIENLGQTKILTILAKPQSEPIKAISKMALYCPQGSGTLRQQLFIMHGIAWYCMVLHYIA